MIFACLGGLSNNKAFYGMGTVKGEPVPEFPPDFTQEKRGGFTLTNKSAPF
jgi:hypothetical protein